MSIIHTSSRSSLVRKLSGFTILEVLIAVIILSVGILGLAGLQAVALRNNHSAFLRSQATMLAYDISDRMRANLTETQADGYDLAAATQNVNCVGTTGCTEAQMAPHDIFEWNSAVANALPNGQAVVCYDTSPEDGTTAAAHACTGAAPGFGVYTIKIWWSDDRTGTLTRFTTNLQP